MNLHSIIENFDPQVLSHSDGFGELKKQALAPLFDNLYENRVIYHERFTCLATIENIEITKDKFSAFIVPIAMVPTKKRMEIPDKLKNGWKISCGWNFMRLINTRVSSSPYANWMIWTEPEKVKLVEHFFEQGKFDEVLKLTLLENRY